MNDSESSWSFILGISAIILGVLSLVRDIFNLQLTWASSQNSLKRLIADRRFQLLIFVILAFSSIWAIYNRINSLEEIVTKQEIEIAANKATIVAINTTVPVLEERSRVLGEQSAHALLQPTIALLQTEVALQSSLSSDRENSRNIPESIVSLINDAMKWSVLAERFNDNRSQWLVRTTTQTEGSPALNYTIDKKYRWEILSGVGFVEQMTLPKYDRVKDFYITVDIQKIRGSDETPYGILFRSGIDETVGEMNYYGFAINNFGEYTIFRGNNFTRIDLQAQKLSPHINLAEINKLGVLALGDRFIFFINDVYITEILETTYDEGNIGFWALSSPNEDLIIEFDNLYLYTPEE